MSTRDLYSVLGVSRSATADEIRNAYRKLARMYHPDVNSSQDAHARFNEIQEAYDVLSDEQKRRSYDRFGHAAPTAASGGPHFTWSNVGGERAGPEFDYDDLGSMFDAFFGARSGGMGGRAGSARGPGKRARAARRSEPEPATHEFEIDFLTAARGGTERFRVVSGSQSRTIDVTIPRGIHDGAKLRIRGAGGEASVAGGSRDLILTIRVRTHPLFRRGDPAGGGEGEPSLDLYLALPLSIEEATLGATVTVPTLEGSVDLTIPPGTPSGMKLRLKGRGLGDGRRTGDLYAVVKIVPPDGRELNASEREALQRLVRRFPGPRTGRDWPGGSGAASS